VVKIMNANKAQVVEIGDTNFESEVLRSTQPVMVAFLTPWSRPCRIIRAVLDNVAIACAGRARVLRVNVDDHPDLGAWYDIQSIPTLLCFVNGNACIRIIGTVSKEAILSKLEPFFPVSESKTLPNTNGTS